MHMCDPPPPGALFTAALPHCPGAGLEVRQLRIHGQPDCCHRQVHRVNGARAQAQASANAGGGDGAAGRRGRHGDGRGARQAGRPQVHVQGRGSKGARGAPCTGGPYMHALGAQPSSSC
eukprot:365306-Chlamydomonas_euryale.AAC.1